MPRTDQGLSAEARDAIRREARVTYFRSMAIALGFAIPASIGFAKQTPFLITLIGFGVPMGLAMPWLHLHVLDRLRHRSFAVTIIRQSAVYIATIALSLTFSLFLVLSSTFLIQGGSLGEAGKVWLSIVSSPWFFGAMPAGLVLVVPIRFVFALSQKLGPGVLRKWMMGHYHEPREEERIFMFLDMKDSTALAEQLGNLRFSALVRDFFQDLTLPVLQTKAEVSHYIGDEAVLTWTIADGTHNANCIRLFFEFEKALAPRIPYYQSTYGLVPGFKAGAHVGQVVATEVGEIKSEIVFHGDVLNTAARIQGLCNESGEALLLSEELASLIRFMPPLSAVPLGSFELKGKELPVSVVAVRTS